MGRPPRVADEELVTLIADLITSNNRGWATTNEIATELPMEPDSVRKRLRRGVADDLPIEGWQPYDHGGWLWRIDPDADVLD